MWVDEALAGLQSLWSLPCSLGDLTLGKFGNYVQQAGRNCILDEGRRKYTRAREAYTALLNQRQSTLEEPREGPRSHCSPEQLLLLSQGVFLPVCSAGIRRQLTRHLKSQVKVSGNFLQCTTQSGSGFRVGESDL